MKQIFGGIIEYEDDKELIEFIESSKNEELILFLEKGFQYISRENLLTHWEMYLIERTFEMLKTLKNEN